MTARERFLIHIMGYMGLPYIWGGDNPKVGLDCSGLAQLCLEYLKLDPPGDQTADGLMRYFKEHGAVVPAKDAQLGDLVFFGSSKATHVALPLGEGLMAEAGGGGSSTKTPEIARKQNAKVRVAPIARRSDVLCVIRPKGLPW